jgi:formate--tetrahydrofolate ligase
LKLGDYCVTEAGFGSDLGAEKFFDIKCRAGGLKPDCVVLVATVRSLKYNGGVPKQDLKHENVTALKAGLANLQVHVENLHKFGVPVVVAINRFYADTKEELNTVEEFCGTIGVEVSVTEVFEKGGQGGVDLANKVCDTIKLCSDQINTFRYLYAESLSIYEKLDIIAKEIYRASSVEYTSAARKAIKEIEDLHLDKVPVCVAKTQYSLSDNPNLLGKPENFSITVKDVKVAAGAGFVVALTGDIMTRPGLPKLPAANSIDCGNDGSITGLF